MRRSLLIMTIMGLVFALALQTASECSAQTKKDMATEGGTGFEVLKGRWLRPDGGYIIQIKSVDGSGRLDAAYYNPRPINVSKAQATRESGKIKVLVELRDTGYPGSTYTLTYHPSEDVLVGVYYQAVMKQSFDVYFTRMK